MFGAFMDAVMQIPRNMHAEEMQDDQQTFAWQANRDQRAWTEQMANTQVQRTAKDMAAAGINPIMAVRQAGTTGAGAGGGAGGSSPTSQGSNFTQAALNSAIAANLKEQTVKETQLGWKASAETEESKQRTNLIMDQSATEKHRAAQTRWLSEQARSTAKGLELEEGIDSTSYGKIMRYIDRLKGAGQIWDNIHPW